MPISEGLKCAYQLISTLCQEPLCVARPEIFTHGKPRDWLDSRLGAARNHICLSDGTAVKLIEGLANHVFFYGLGRRKGSADLQNLLTWAPEVFSHIRSQINSFHGALLRGRLIQPPTMLSLTKFPLPAPPAEIYEFCLYPQCPEEGARRIMEKGAIPGRISEEFKELIYIPFSESGAYDAIFTGLVAQTIAAAYFNPDQCVLVRLPTLSDVNADLARQITATLEAIRASGIVMPRVAAKNVFLVRYDLPEDFFDTHERVSFIFDDTFEFWRYTRAFFTQLHSVRYLLCGDRRRLQGVVRALTDILGRPPSKPSILPAMPPILLTWNLDSAVSSRQA
jgi:hypothetical protein